MLIGAGQTRFPYRIIAFCNIRVYFSLICSIPVAQTALILVLTNVLLWRLLLRTEQNAVVGM